MAHVCHVNGDLDEDLLAFGVPSVDRPSSPSEPVRENPSADSPSNASSVGNLILVGERGPFMVVVVVPPSDAEEEKLSVLASCLCERARRKLRFLLLVVRLMNALIFRRLRERLKRGRRDVEGSDSVSSSSLRLSDCECTNAAFPFP